MSDAVSLGGVADTPYGGASEGAAESVITQDVTNIRALDGTTCMSIADSTGVVTASKLISFTAASGTAAANALLMGIGTSGDPATTATAGKVFAEFRTQTTATSGDSRSFYLRHELKGAGVSGEALRAFSKVSAAIATGRGAHISLDINNSPAGSVTGLGVGVDAQILMGNAALSAGGTYAVLNSEIYSAGSSSDMGAATEVSFVRFSNGGDATGAATIDDDAFLFVLTGFTSGAAHLWYDNQKAAPAVEEFVKVKTPSGTRYLALYDANA